VQSIVITLSPRRSLDADGLRTCTAISAVVIMIPTAVCVASGLWGTLPFALLSLLILVWALRLSARRGEDFHRVTILHSR
jgi:uncharacterized membrane protein